MVLRGCDPAGPGRRIGSRRRRKPPPDRPRPVTQNGRLPMRRRRAIAVGTAAGLTLSVVAAATALAPAATAASQKHRYLVVARSASDLGAVKAEASRSGAEVIPGPGTTVVAVQADRRPGRGSQRHRSHPHGRARPTRLARRPECRRHLASRGPRPPRAQRQRRASRGGRPGPGVRAAGPDVEPRSDRLAAGQRAHVRVVGRHRGRGRHRARLHPLRARRTHRRPVRLRHGHADEVCKTYFGADDADLAAHVRRAGDHRLERARLAGSAATSPGPRRRRASTASRRR